MQKFYPLGTVVEIKNEKDSLVIIGRGLKSPKDGTIVDYLAVKSITGFESVESIILFNETEIIRIIKNGYRDAEEEKYHKLLLDAIK